MSKDTVERHPSRRNFLRLAIRSGIGLSALSLGSIAYGSTIEAGWLDVNHVALRLPRLGSQFDGYRVAQISDIHMDEWMTPARLSHAVSVINAQRPNVVAITGDFVTLAPQHYAPGLISALEKLKARDAVVAVLGNHDHWTAPSVIRRVLRDSGIIDLSNKVHSVRRKGEELHVAGVDDYWERKADLGAVMKQLPQRGAAILLAHEPDFADISAATGRFDLQMSGHSHGGQVRLPFMPLRLPKYGKKYPSGRYRVRDMIQYTNRGLGMVGPHARFRCRPEVTVFTLYSGAG
jgi:predicted MPP superfamily phosphohydrolase